MHWQLCSGTPTGQPSPGPVACVTLLHVYHGAANATAASPTLAPVHCRQWKLEACRNSALSCHQHPFGADAF